MRSILSWHVPSGVRLTLLLIYLTLYNAKAQAPKSKANSNVLNPQSTQNFKMDTWKYQKKFSFVGTETKESWKQGGKIKYDSKHFNNKNIYIHAIPWTHADPGYKSSYTNSFNTHTSKIITAIVNALTANPSRRFIWAECSILQRWYASASAEMKDALKALIHNGQLEIVSGGWVMPDEALTHYEALLEELMEGHDWMIRALGVKPKVSFSTDAIGHSPIMSYILKKSGFEGSIINRIHHAYKRELAENRSLEFMWTPPWSENPEDRLFTHVHPFINLDMPYSCGPNPGVCAAYDFTNSGKRTPWGTPVEAVTAGNVGTLANAIVEQYRQYAMLFRTNHIPVFLGGMSYYESEKDLGTQFDSYQMLFDQINKESKYKMHASFSNLSYWLSKVSTSNFYPNDDEDMPIVRGDFFNYADTENDFWTGHYSTRTFFKKFSRGVGSMSKSVNSLFALLTAFGREPSDKADLPVILQRARRSIALYQNHHGISGVSSKAAMREYVKNLHESRWKLKNTYLLLAQHALSREGFPTTAAGDDFELSEKKKRFNEIIMPTTIVIPKTPDSVRTLVFYNNLPHTRAEYATVRTDTPNVVVRNADGEVVIAQVCPSYDPAQDKLAVSTSVYTVTFPVRVPALGMTTMFISRAFDDDENTNNNIQRCEIITTSPSTFGSVTPKGAKSLHVLGSSEAMCVRNTEISLCINKTTGLINSVKSGLIKDDNDNDNENSGYEKFEEEYVMYGTSTPNDGQVLMSVSDLGKAVKPPTRGVGHALFRGIYTDEHAYQTGGRLRIVRVWKDTSAVRGINALGLRYADISIKDLFREDALAMRVKTGVRGRKEYKLKFVTDVNGFGYAERVFRKDLPNSANFFPVTTSLRIQDQTQREAFLVAQPMGATCYKTVGDTVTCEFILDRKTHSDDKKGISDKVEDGVPTVADFRVSFEEPDNSEVLDSPTASELSHALSMRLNNPLELGVGIEHKPGAWKKSFGVEIAPLTSDLPLDVEIPNFQVATSALGAGEVALTVARHIVGRHVTQRSQKDEVCISLTDLFKCAQVVDVTEHTLTYLQELSEADNTAIIDGTVCIQKGSMHSYTFNVQVDQECRAYSMGSPRPSKWTSKGDAEAEKEENANDNPFFDTAFDDNVPPGIPEDQAKMIANDRIYGLDNTDDKKGEKDPLEEDLFDEGVNFGNFKDAIKQNDKKNKYVKVGFIENDGNKDDDDDKEHKVNEPKPETKKNYHYYNNNKNTNKKHTTVTNDEDDNNANKNYGKKEKEVNRYEKENVNVNEKEDEKEKDEDDDLTKNNLQNQIPNTNINNNNFENKKPTHEFTPQQELPLPVEIGPEGDGNLVSRNSSGKIQLGIIAVSMSFLISFFLFIKRAISAKVFAILLVATALINTVIFVI